MGEVVDEGLDIARNVSRTEDGISASKNVNKLTNLDGSKEIKKLEQEIKNIKSSNPEKDLITVYRVQQITESNIVTGGAFKDARKTSNLVAANSERLKYAREFTHTNPNRRIRAMEGAQANAKNSPVISTTKDKELALNELNRRNSLGTSNEVLVIRGKKSAGIDFEEIFEALGGRISKSRARKDPMMQEFGIFDLFIPPNKPSKSGFEIIERIK